MNLLAILGGKYAITLRAWLILLPISVFLTASFTPDGSIGSYPQWMLLGLFGHVATGGILFLALLIRRNVIGVVPRALVTVAAFFVAGAVRGLTVSFLGDQLAIIANADYIDRIRSGATLVTVWFSFAAAIIDSYMRYVSSVKKAVNAAQEKALLATNSERYVLEYRSQTENEVQKTLERVLENVQTPEELAQTIREVLDPVTQEIDLRTLRLGLDAATVSVERKRHLSAQQVLRIMYFECPFNPLPVVLVFFLSTASSRLWVTSFPTFVVDLVMNTGWVFLILSSARSLLSRGSRVVSRLVLPIWALTAYGSAVITVSLNVSKLTFASKDLILFVIGILIAILLTAALDAYRTLLKRQAADIEGLSKQISWYSSALTQSLWLEKRRLTRLVHSQVQSRVLATATRIARLSPDGVLTQSELDELREVCVQAITAAEEHVSIPNFLEEMAEVFEGATKISWDVDPSASQVLDSNTDASSAVLEVLREGINNAVKHGKASQVHAEIDAESTVGLGQCLTIRVTNDGIPKDQHLRRGIGSETLDQIASTWRIEARESQTELTVVVPVAMASSR